MKLLLYLLQVSACTGVFYLFYHLALRQLTFFKLNRWYLLATLLLSFAVPVLTIPVPQPERAAVAATTVTGAGVAVSTSQTGAVQASTEITAPVTIATAPALTSVNYEKLLVIAYLGVAAILLLRLLLSLFLIGYRLNTGAVERTGNIRLIRNSSYLRTGSFFHYVFLTDTGLTQQEQELVVAHEAVHVRQLHSVDKLIAGFVQVVLWFNPFTYAYAHAIDANHEFEVDDALTAETEKQPYAELLLRLAVGETKLYHHFSKLPLQKRIRMLYYTPTAAVGKLTYLLCLPVLAGALFAFAQRNPVAAPEKDNMRAEAMVRAATSPLADNQEQGQPGKPSVDGGKAATVTNQQTAVLEDYQALKKLQVGKTTKADLVRLLGEPEGTSETGGYLWYEWKHRHNDPGKVGFITFKARFGKNEQLADFFYSRMGGVNPETKPALTEEKVRALKLNLSTDKDVLDLFGETMTVLMSANYLFFGYRIKQPGASHAMTTLSVFFSNTNSDTVRDYTFSTRTDEPVTINQAQVKKLAKGKSTLAEARSRLGEPNGKNLGSFGERWMYTTQTEEYVLDFRENKGTGELVLDDVLALKLP